MESVIYSEETEAKEYIIDKVTSNSDYYNPSQISCFNKPWAINFKSLNESYYDLYLFEIIYYQYFMINNYFSWDNYLGNLNENYYKFSKEVLENKFPVSIEKVTYESGNESEFHEKMQEAIRMNYRIIVPGDLIGLFYYPQYMIESHIHFFCVKGYDAKRKVYFIVDNAHNDSGSNPTYKDFAIKYDDMFLLNKLCFTNFFDYEEKPYFWILIKENESCKKSYSINSALIQHKELLKQINKGIVSIKFPEEDILTDEIKEVNNFRLYYAQVINYKHVYYELLFKFLEEANMQKETINKLMDIKTEIVKNWEEIRMKMLYILATDINKRFSLQDVVNANIELEYKFREELIKAIEDLELSIVNTKKKLEMYKLRLLNNNSAEILLEDPIRIKHCSDRTYDTWLNQDNAAQILFNINNEDYVEFQCKVNTPNAVGFAFLGGIILKNRNGNKYIYGNESNNIISIHCPQLYNEHLIASEAYYNDSVYIKVVLHKSNVKFYFKNNYSDMWIKLHESNDIYVDEIGMISKTWDCIEHLSIFSEIYLKVNDNKIFL